MSTLHPFSWKHENITMSLEVNCVTLQLALEDFKPVVEAVNSFFATACDLNYSFEVCVKQTGLAFIAYLDDSVDLDLLTESVEAFLETFKLYNLELVSRPQKAATSSFFGTDEVPAWRLGIVYRDKETQRKYTLSISLRIPSWSKKWHIEHFDDQQKFTWWKATRK